MNNPEWRKIANASNKKFRGHMLVTADYAKWPALYGTERIPTEDKVFVAKFFCGGWTWWVVEIDADTGECFGFVEGPSPEWGYFSIPELAALRPGFPLVVERDCHFTATPAADVLGTSV